MDPNELLLMNAAGIVKTVDDVTSLLKTPVTHIVVGSITVEAREGNPEPRFWISPDGSHALNSLGLPNPGSEYYAAHLRVMRNLCRDSGKALVVSIVGFTLDEWYTLSNLASNYANMLVVNLGCPNIWKSGERKPILSYDPEAIVEVYRSVWQGAWLGTKFALKFSPCTCLIEPECVRRMQGIVAAIKECDERFHGGRREITIISHNTIPDVVPPTIDGKPVISMPSAEKSGPDIFAGSLLQMTHLARELPGFRKIAAGGIRSGADVFRMVQAGANGVKIGTHFFQYGPKVFAKILQEYAEMCV